MFKFLSRLWIRFTGWFGRAGDDLVTSGPSAIKDVYAVAIADGYEQLSDMRKALGMLKQQRQRLGNQIEQTQYDLTRSQQVLAGALSQAKAEPGNKLHRKAGSKALTRIKELEAKIERYQAEHTSLGNLYDNHMGKLAEMQLEVESLKSERSAAMAEFLTAKNTLRIEEKLSSLSTESAVDASVIAIREKIENMKAQAQVAMEMRGALPSADIYAEIGAEQRAEDEFDKLLEAHTTMRPALTSSSDEAIDVKTEKREREKVVAREIG